MSEALEILRSELHHMQLSIERMIDLIGQLAGGDDA
jgi:hypothetical protein